MMSVPSPSGGCYPFEQNTQNFPRRESKKNEQHRSPSEFRLLASGWALEAANQRGGTTNAYYYSPTEFFEALQALYPANPVARKMCIRRPHEAVRLYIAFWFLRSPKTLEEALSLVRLVFSFFCGPRGARSNHAPRRNEVLLRRLDNRFWRIENLVPADVRWHLDRARSCLAYGDNQAFFSGLRCALEAMVGGDHLATAIKNFCWRHRLSRQVRACLLTLKNHGNLAAHNSNAAGFGMIYVEWTDFDVERALEMLLLVVESMPRVGFGKYRCA